MPSSEVVVMQLIDNFFETILNGLILALGSLALWLIRTVFTNQKKLDAFEKELKRRDDVRSEDLTLIRSDIQEVRQDIKDLMMK
jgi:hypothetical protein